jgi:hypothetical protein
LHEYDIVRLQQVSQSESGLLNDPFVILSIQAKARLRTALSGSAAHRETLHDCHVAFQPERARRAHFAIDIEDGLTRNVQRVASLHEFVLHRSSDEQISHLYGLADHLPVAVTDQINRLGAKRLGTPGGGNSI